MSTVSRTLDDLTAYNRRLSDAIAQMEAFNWRKYLGPEQMANAYRPFQTARKDALEAEKQRPWNDKERQRFMAAGGLQ